MLFLFHYSCLYTAYTENKRVFGTDLCALYYIAIGLDTPDINDLVWREYGMRPSQLEKV